MTRSSSVFLAALALAGSAATGCTNQEIAPFLGKWNGRFVLDAQEGQSEADRKREELSGYLQIYRTGDRFQMHLSGEQQAVTATGTWTAKDSRISLRVLDLQIDDGGGEKDRDVSKKYLPPEDLQAAYSGRLVLDLRQDKLGLVGLKSNIGPLIGRHEFQKVTHEYTY